MFLKRKAKKALKKISNGAKPSEIQSALNDVVKEATRVVSKKMGKMEFRLPIKVTISR